MTTAYELVGRYYDEQLIQPMAQLAVGRKAAYTADIKGDIDTVEVYTSGNLSDAFITYTLPEHDQNSDMFSLTPTTLKIPFIYKDFKIRRSEFNKWQNNKNVKLDTQGAMLAAQEVVQIEEATIFVGKDFDGDGSYTAAQGDVVGFYTGAGNDYSTSKDFGTFGNALDAVAGAKALCAADHCYATKWNLFLNPIQYAELESSFDVTGGFEWDVVMKRLGGGGIFQTEAITVDKGLLMPDDPTKTFFDIVVPIDMYTQVGPFGPFPDDAPIYGRVKEALVPRIKQSVAIAKLSAI